MPSVIDKKKIYRECRIATGMDQYQWGRLFNLGNTKNAHQAIYKKEMLEAPGPGTSSRGPNNSDILAAQLLKRMREDGYDIDNMVFDLKTGRIKKLVQS